MSAVTIEYTEPVVEVEAEVIQFPAIGVLTEGTTVTIEFADGELLDAEVIGQFGDGSLALIDEVDDVELVLTLDEQTRIITVH